MSHTLAQLRRQLDDPLLVRRGNDMVLTPRAEELRSPLGRALADLDAALHGPAPFDPATARVRFTIAASDAVAVRFLPSLVDRCCREAPGVELDVVPYDRQRVEEALHSGDVDLAIGPPMRDAVAGISQRALYVSDFVVALRDGHPLGRRRWSIDAYCDAGHVVVGLGGAAPSAVDSALAARKRSRRIVARVPYFLAAPILVAQTDLIVTAARATVEPLAAGLGLRLVAPPIALPKTRIALFFHDRLAASPGHRWLRDTLVAAVRDTVS